ncbi:MULTISPECIES: DUF6884 domain-containing protein [Leptolyngbya]|uniref:DUF6884 domain-containing protein n=1 Tax=Leptolyngbya TaxID=47251 RepID=UPI00168835C8|nr:DUF6884 domain-containing protein [Leptolyngbya sp. FACHB-1624]MBD1859968.1 hypothetical protein [Leptolyngbya sp. FACHB-1624]
MRKYNHLALISCVDKKSTEPSAAKDLYQSNWFLKARTYVEQQEWNWCILSAKYGLLHQDAIIEPYERTLNSLSADQRRQWSEKVFDQILQTHSNAKLIHMFAGKHYRQYLVPLLKEAGYIVEVPLEGFGIGQQLSWFKSHILNYGHIPHDF